MLVISLSYAIQFPEGFLPLIKKLKVGEILKPHRIGKWNVIIQLHELIQAQFDFEGKCFILKVKCKHRLRLYPRSSFLV